MAAVLTLANGLIEDTVLGRGLKCPLGVDPATGDWATVSGADNVKQCVIDIIETDPGERLMNEDYGTGLTSALFEDPEVVVDIAPTRILTALAKHETRIKNVTVRAEQKSDTLVEITVAWTLRSTGDRDSLVYPYYTNPSAGGVTTNE